MPVCNGHTLWQFRVGLKLEGRASLLLVVLHTGTQADNRPGTTMYTTCVNQAISVAVQRVVAFNILEYRYTSLPKPEGRVAVHAQAEPGGADWDDDEPEAQQEPVEGAAPGGGRGQVTGRWRTQRGPGCRRGGL